MKSGRAAHQNRRWGIARVAGIVLVMTVKSMGQDALVDHSADPTGQNGQHSSRSSSPFYFQSQIEQVSQRIEAHRARERRLTFFLTEVDAERDVTRQALDTLTDEDGAITRSVALRKELKEFASGDTKQKTPSPTASQPTAAAAQPDEGAAQPAEAASPPAEAATESGGDAAPPAEAASESGGAAAQPADAAAEAAAKDSPNREIQADMLTTEFESLISSLNAMKRLAEKSDGRLADTQLDFENFLREEEAKGDKPTSEPSHMTSTLRSYASRTEGPSDWGTESFGPIESQEKLRPIASESPDMASLVAEWQTLAQQVDGTASKDALVSKLFQISAKVHVQLTGVQRTFHALDRRGTTLKAKIEEELSKTEYSLDRAVAERDAYQAAINGSYADLTRKARLNPYLVTAIVLMIVAMVLLYFSLSWFRPEFASKIIRHRVLIELLSMSFLLLTVIILGTGRLLDSTALAALLGTMAGYIFGRKNKRKPDTSKPSENNGGDPDATPPDPASGGEVVSTQV